MAKKSGEYRVGDWTPNSTIETRGITYVSGEVIPVDHLPAKEVERLVADGYLVTDGAESPTDDTEKGEN